MDRFTLFAPFTKRRGDWLRLPCANVHDGRSYRLALRQTAALDKVVLQTFGAILRLYLRHPEAKSLTPDGPPRGPDTVGLLRRVSITADQHRPIGKEVDRKSERGDDLSVLDSRMTDFTPAMVSTDATQKVQMLACGVRPLMRKTRLSQHTLEKILRGEPVRPRTLERVIDALRARA